MNKSRVLTLLDRVGYWVVFSAPFLIFLVYSYRYAVNVPYYDDYDLVLDNLSAFLLSHSVPGKLAILYAQFNEHRLLFDKLVILVQYYLTGRVNFRGLILFGDLGLVLAVLFLCYQLKKSGLTRIQILPAPFLLLAFTHYENMFFATPSIQFYWSILFALLFFESLIQARSVLISCLLCAITIFTIASGLLLLPIGAAVLGLNKRCRDLGIFLAAAVVLTALYFFHYQSVPDGPSIQYSLGHLGETILYFLAFLGSFILTQAVAVPVGLLIAVVLVASITIHPDEPRLAPLSAWVLLLAAANAVSRTGLGTPQALSSRYTIYSLLGLLCAYIWLIKREALRTPSRENAYSIMAALLCIGFYVAVFTEYQTRNQFAIDMDRRVAGLASFAATGQATYLIHPSPNHAAKVLMDASKLGTYDAKLTALRLQHPPLIFHSLPPTNAKFQGKLEQNDGVHLQGWAIIPGLGTGNATVTVLLRNGNTIIGIPTNRTERPDVSKRYGVTFLYYYSGYDVYLAAYAIPPGGYQVGELVRNGAYAAVHWEPGSVAIR